MEPRKLGPITIGIAGAARTSGIGIIMSRLASGQGGVMDTCLVLAMSVVTTSLIAALGLILNYRYYSPGLLLTGLVVAGARSAGLTERDGHLTIMVCETSEQRGGRRGHRR